MISLFECMLLYTYLLCVCVCKTLKFTGGFDENKSATITIDHEILDVSKNLCIIYTEHGKSSPEMEIIPKRFAKLINSI